MEEAQACMLVLSKVLTVASPLLAVAVAAPKEDLTLAALPAARSLYRRSPPPAKPPPPW
jgi:hypothetical protein